MRASFVVELLVIIIIDGSGSFELRGDGTFADWMVENQGTALAANADQNSKVPFKDEAFIGLYAASHGGSGAKYAAAVRTAAAPIGSEGGGGIPNAAGLAYSGAHPFSRLAVADPALAPLLNATLFAYSQFKLGDANASGTPAAVFTVVLTNPSASDAVDAAVLLSLPLGGAANTDRPLSSDARHQLLATLNNTASSSACAAACAAYAGGACVWWRYSGDGVPPVPAQVGRSALWNEA